MVLPSVNYARKDCLQITDSILKGFSKWLITEEGTGGRTVRDYLSYLSRVKGLEFCGKGDVTEAFRLMGGVNDKSYKAFRRLLTYVERKVEGYDDLITKLVKALPHKPRSKEDTYVPTDEEVLNVKRNIMASGDNALKLLYNVLVSTGCRGTEARYLINNIGRLRTVDLGPYVRVHVDLQRGSKNEFIMYLPKEVYQQIKEFRGELPHKTNISKAFSEAGLPQKYLRKWFRQTLKKLGIDSEDIEAFQGRVTTIGGRHYTDWIPLLDKDYMRILPHIRKFIIGGEPNG